jgi:hypothetical protein
MSEPTPTQPPVSQSPVSPPPGGYRPGFSPEEMKARKRRNLWTVLALLGFIALVFVITLTKLGANVLVRDL